MLATLIENSLRYGGGTTRVWAHAGSSKRGVIIEVSDEGEGIDEALAPDIFEKGVSGHGSTGIGLALAHDLAQAMGGAWNSSPICPPFSRYPSPQSRRPWTPIASCPRGRSFPWDAGRGASKSGVDWEAWNAIC